MNRRKHDEEDHDAAGLQEVIVAIWKGMGRGGLTYLSNRLGMTPSALRKRLLSPNAFDAVSLRALLLVVELKEEDDAIEMEGKKKGKYIIGTKEVDGETQPTWRTRK